MKTVEDENIYSNLAEFVLSDLGLIYRYKAPEPPTLRQDAEELFSREWVSIWYRTV